MGVERLEHLWYVPNYVSPEEEKCLLAEIQATKQGWTAVSGLRARLGLLRPRWRCPC